jgi:hypothetical protein
MTTEETQEAQQNTNDETQAKEENKHPGLDHLDEATKSEILSLRKEAKDRRLKYKELSAEFEKMKDENAKSKEAKLIEEGKIQELLEERTKELEELKPLRDKLNTYETQFEAQLEAIVSKLSKDQQELISESGWDIAKKLTWANKLAEQAKVVSNGPDSKRPGGDINADDVNLDDYTGPQGRIKLAKLKLENPKKWETVMSLRK